MFTKAMFDAMGLCRDLGEWPFAEKDVPWSMMCGYIPDPYGADAKRFGRGADAVVFWLCQRLDYDGFWRLWVELTRIAACRHSERMACFLAHPDPIPCARVWLDLAGYNKWITKTADFLTSYIDNDPDKTWQAKRVFTGSFKAATEMVINLLAVAREMQGADADTGVFLKAHLPNLFDEFMGCAVIQLGAVADLRVPESIAGSGSCSPL